MSALHAFLTKSFRFALAAVLLLIAAPCAPAQENNDDLLTRESLGGIKVGMTEKALAPLLGKAPLKKGKEQTNAETGLVFQVWSSPAKGLSLQMIHQDGEKGPLVVSTITATGKCPLTTTKGIKIGSTLEEVRAAYGKLHENGPDQFLAGNAADSVGLFFTIKDGKVAEIFFGAAT